MIDRLLVIVLAADPWPMLGRLLYEDVLMFAFQSMWNLKDWVLNDPHFGAADLNALSDAITPRRVCAFAPISRMPRNILISVGLGRTRRLTKGVGFMWSRQRVLTKSSTTWPLSPVTSTMGWRSGSCSRSVAASGNGLSTSIISVKRTGGCARAHSGWDGRFTLVFLSTHLGERVIAGEASVESRNVV